jgi:hypothetical protein
MGCRSKHFLQIIVILLSASTLCGCVTIRIDKVSGDADIKPLPHEFIVGTTTLADVMDFYGAPVDIEDMENHFAIHYQKFHYRGVQLSFGIPFSNQLQESGSFGASGMLLRYDSAIFIFTLDGILSEMAYARDTDRPLWNTYWQ